MFNGRTIDKGQTEDMRNHGHKILHRLHGAKSIVHLACTSYRDDVDINHKDTARYGPIARKSAALCYSIKTSLFCFVTCDLADRCLLSYHVKDRMLSATEKLGIRLKRARTHTAIARTYQTTKATTIHC